MFLFLIAPHFHLSTNDGALNCVNVDHFLRNTFGIYLGFFPHQHMSFLFWLIRGHMPSNNEGVCGKMSLSQQC